MYVVDYVRTPFGKYKGAFAHSTATDLLTHTLAYLKHRHDWLADLLDAIIVGNVLSAGTGLNLATSSLRNAFPQTDASSMCINQACISGIQAIELARCSIETGRTSVVIAAGVESMSKTPMLFSKVGDGDSVEAATDSLILDGLTCPSTSKLMGQIAQRQAIKNGISREKQDSYAFLSHQKSVKATNILKKEITPFLGVTMDEGPRQDTSAKKLAALKPVFDVKGTITAANASPLSDGAAALLICSKKIVEKLQLNPIAKITASSQVCVKPDEFESGQSTAITQLLHQTSDTIAAIDSWEIHEPFASSAIQTIEKIGIDPHKVNTNGGALAIGHPLATSGIRMVGTLAKKLKKSQKGIVSMCAGGGQGIAMLVEAYA